MKMNTARGFIQIPLLIVILIGVTAVGSIGYVGFERYSESKEREQELATRIESLEKQVEQTASTTELATEESENQSTETTEKLQTKEKSVSVSKKPILPAVKQDQVSTPTSVVTLTPVVITEPPQDFRASCNVSETVLKQEEYVDVELEIYFDRPSNYEVVWSKNPDRTDNSYDVSYRFGTPGEQNISATVTRKSDGYSKQIKCPLIVVECSEYSCLSLKEKQILLLKDILDEIDSWYEGEYASLGPVSNCLISESKIRGYIYEYETILRGTNIPEFSSEEDCSNSVAPRAYQVKIQLLIDNLQ